MTRIHVPRPPKGAYNPERPISSLLKSQVDHLREAESKLPLRYRSERYIKAIQTEGEAAHYIREVTEAIRAAHEDAERARRAPKPKIAAVADERAERQRATKAARKRTSTRSSKTGGKTRRTK
jgi:hypothetical protein